MIDSVGSVFALVKGGSDVNVCFIDTLPAGEACLIVLTLGPSSRVVAYIFTWKLSARVRPLRFQSMRD